MYLFGISLVDVLYFNCVFLLCVGGQLYERCEYWYVVSVLASEQFSYSALNSTHYLFYSQHIFNHSLDKKGIGIIYEQLIIRFVKIGER